MLYRSGWKKGSAHADTLKAAEGIVRWDRDFERDFARWAPQVKAIATAGDLEALVEKLFRPARAALASRFAEAFRRLTTKDLQAYRLRYLLAKLTQAVELA